MATRKVVCAVAAAIAAVSPAQSMLTENEMTTKTVQLTHAGTSDWSIAVPAGAGEVEQFAASELRKYIGLMSGAGFPQTTAPASGKTILVGVRKDLKSAIALPDAKKGFDGYSVAVTPQGIVVAGENARGALYGAYDLLERLGCRWWMPNLDPRDPEVVPRNPDLSLPEGTWAEAGAIEIRLYNGSAFFFEVVPGRVLPQIEWAARNRYNFIGWQPHHLPGKMEEELEQFKACGAFDEMRKRGIAFHGPCHSFPQFLPTDRYFKDHPEWFGLLDGKRQPHGGKWPIANYCWSNAEANEEFMRNVESFVKRWPQIKILNLEWIDGGVVCRCPECEKRGGANLIIELFNTLSERLAKVAPDVMLEMVLGYGPIDDPPTGSQPNGKWQGVYAHWGRNMRTSYDDPDYFRRPNMLVWTSYFPLYQICSYYGAGSHTPINGPPFLHALEKDTKYLVEHNARGTYVLHYPHPMWWNCSFTLGEAGRQSYYYPDRSVRESLRDLAMSYYGPKVGPLADEYLCMLGSNENLENSYRASVGDAKDDDLKWFAEMRVLMNRMQMLAADDEVTSYRVAKLGSSLELITKTGTVQRGLADAKAAMEQWREGKAKADDVQTTIAAARAYGKEVRAMGDRLEAAYPGTAAGEWLESWTINRVLYAPLDKLEKELKGEAPAEKSAKPAHVAGPQ
jgi:hypothetical protein